MNGQARNIIIILHYYSGNGNGPAANIVLIKTKD